jgi:ribose transport system permease protein
MFKEEILTIGKPLADRGDRKAYAWPALLAASRAWLFLGFLLVVFELWAECFYGRTFLFNAFNIQSIAVFTIAPLLLGLGQTFVVISGGIDLSVGFTMGLSSVVLAHVVNATSASAGPLSSLALGVLAGIAVAFVPGIINGLLISKLRIPPFIGTLGMYGVARGAAYLLARGTTVPVTNGPLDFIGNGMIGPLPIVVLIAFVIVAIMH